MSTTREIRKQRYIKALGLYGFYTLLNVMDEEINKENYEECQIILDAIMTRNKELNINLPTKFDKQAEKYFRDRFKERGLTGDVTLANMPHYAEAVRKIVNEEM